MCLRRRFLWLCLPRNNTISLRLSPPPLLLETIQRRVVHQGKEEKDSRPRLGRYVPHKGTGTTLKLRSNTNLECTMLIISHALQPSRSSLTNSYVKNDVAMLGATFTVQSSSVPFLRHFILLYARKFGQSPRYIPRIPSVLIITRAASSAPLYWYPRAPAPRPTTCIFRRRTSNGYVSVCDTDPIVIGPYKVIS